MFLHCFPSPLFQATYMKYVDGSMLRVGCLRQLPTHWQYVHSTNISKCKREPKGVKGFIRFAHELYCLQVVFPCVLKFGKKPPKPKKLRVFKPNRSRHCTDHVPALWECPFCPQQFCNIISILILYTICCAIYADFIFRKENICDKR